ncbi:DUF3421 domain-containing protein [Pseudoalteromonas sp. Of7M-16]|uniref:DUF3421 domain-containing protein n=1 Tax=Pseudoalteromonas sp. Of7M-16 TaxID=2917756 RepID=UPI001EF5C9DB|nr:DUF3421 domain-containing protein [Pseudoalteromonas sp. Of7M-16]MCG7547415.1 DUF3421 domain-containing protein [Pseudoalteromonas sp. Of7M-16]
MEKHLLMMGFMSAIVLVSVQVHSREFVQCGGSGHHDSGRHEGGRQVEKQECSWTDSQSNRQIPQFSVKFEHDGTSSTETVFICRDLGHVLGRLVNGICYTSWYGREFANKRFQVLTMASQNYRWEVATERIDLYGATEQTDKYLVKGSYESGFNTYVCGVTDGHGVLRAGKLLNGYCWYGAGGRERSYPLASGRVHVLFYTES